MQLVLKAEAPRAGPAVGDSHAPRTVVSDQLPGLDPAAVLSPDPTRGTCLREVVVADLLLNDPGSDLRWLFTIRRGETASRLLNAVGQVEDTEPAPPSRSSLPRRRKTIDRELAVQRSAALARAAPDVDC